MSSDAYTPPAVWTWEPGNGGNFANINRPTAGATHEAELPRGQHGYQLYSMGTPNGQKVTILFEELLEAGFAEAEYDAWPIRIMEGAQFSSGFVDINPNSKIPALLDLTGPEPVRVFESGAILLHLAERFGAFVPVDPGLRAECLSWLFWQVGSGPMLGGGFGHFYAYAPEKNAYAINRFAMEVKRQMDVLDQRLATSEFVAGADYTIADMAIWPWYGRMARGELYSAGTFLDVASYANLQRWAEAVGSRPAVRRGQLVNNLSLPEEQRVSERHGPEDFAGKL